VNTLLQSAAVVLAELTKELIRRSHQEGNKDRRSQVSACLFLAIRSASLLSGIGQVLRPDFLDSAEVLNRAFLESRDLLMTFRFDHDETRQRIAYWFNGKVDSSWKANHDKCNQFWKKRGYQTDFGLRWSQSTTLSHPTVYASTNSLNCASIWAVRAPLPPDISEMVDFKRADFLMCINTLIVITTIDGPGLVSLGCDPSRMAHNERFRAEVSAVAQPIIDKHVANLPSGSYRGS
jgi:hypothetical protein